ncbi:MAG: hypothetical protein IKF64_05270 [Eubacterium sp.]|nr:hypothetical protein [Eubacterium sp.]
MDKKERRKGIFKFFLSTTGLLLVFVMIFNSFSTIFVQPEDDRCYSLMHGFYKEKDDSLDAVFISSSTSYANFNIMMAWQNYGINAFTLATPHQPIYAAEYIFTEAVKTQPNALYVFNLGTVCEYFEKDQLYAFHAILDYMPFSFNKVKLTKYLLDNAEMKYMENSEYFFPLVRYHDKWTDWDGTDYHKELDGVKGAPHYKQYKYRKRNVEKLYKETDEVNSESPQAQKIKECMSRLFEQIKANNANAMFIIVPTAGKTIDIHQHINYAKQLAEEAGYPVLDMQDKKLMDSIGLDLTTDYYNDNHPNIHGSVKTTKFIAEYLLNNYDFKDKRYDDSYKAKKSWDEALVDYQNMIKAYSLEQEYTFQIDNSFAAPKISASAEGKGEIEINVKLDKSADGYRIYRKEGNYDSGYWWSQICELPSDVTTYTDKADADKTYTYTAIAYKKDGDNTVWSKYKYFGVTVTDEK